VTKRTHFSVVFRVMLLSITALLLSGCDRISLSYKPPFSPVKLAIDSQGNVSVVGDVSIVTFVGEFSIGAEYTLKEDPDSILVTIRDREKGDDTIYRVRTDGDRFVAVLNGNTVVQVENNQVLIDVTNAAVESIEFKRADSTIPETGFEKDFFATTAVKTIIIFYVLILAVILTCATVVFDAVLIIWGFNFLLTRGVWAFVWQTVIIDWYWNHANMIGVLIGVLIVLAATFKNGLPWRK
jgi:hypothetical protein